MDSIQIIIAVVILSFLYLTLVNRYSSLQLIPNNYMPMWGNQLQYGGQLPPLYNSGVDRPLPPSVVTTNQSNYVPRVEWLSTPFKAAQRDPHFPVPPNLSPAQQLPILINKYGSPDIIYPKPGGLAVWTSETLKSRGFCLERIIISDYPSNYLNYRIYLPLKMTRGTTNTQDLIDDLAVLHPVVSYDEIKQLLELDANRDEDAMALFIPVIRLMMGRISYTEAQQLFQPLLESVNPYTNTYDSQASRYYEEEICATQRSILVNLV